MVEKKGFFSFLKGTSKTAYLDEETKQREYALSKKMEEQITEQSQILSQGEEVEEDLPSELSDEMVQSGVEKLAEILNDAGFKSEVKVIKLSGKKMFLEIVSEDDNVGRIIGKDGSTLAALQTILNAILFKKYNVPIKGVLDAGNYHAKRIETLRGNALNMAKIVIRRKEKVELKPMNSAERRVIHMLFKNNLEVRSYSSGEGINRHVVLEYKDENNIGNGNRI